MCRFRAAAAADDTCAGIDQCLHGSGEFVRSDIINRIAVYHLRYAGIRFGDHRHLSQRPHFPDDRHHLLRSGAAVDANGVRAERLQGDDGRLRVGPVKGAAVLIKRKRHADRQAAGLAGRNQRGAAFIQTHHRLDDQKIRAGFLEAPYLLLVDIDQRLKREFPDRLQLLPGHGQITRDQRTAAGCLPGKADQFCIDFFEPVFEAVFGQFDPVSRKCRGKNNVGTCLHVGALQIQYHIGVLQNPLLRTYAGRHAGFHQVGACRTVQQYCFIPAKLCKIFSVHRTISFACSKIFRIRPVRLNGVIR